MLLLMKIFFQSIWIFSIEQISYAWNAQPTLNMSIKSLFNWKEIEAVIVISRHQMLTFMWSSFLICCCSVCAKLYMSWNSSLFCEYDVDQVQELSMLAWKFSQFDPSFRVSRHRSQWTFWSNTRKNF